MKYEFHVGDYVETINSIKGFVNKIEDNGQGVIHWIVTDTNCMSNYERDEEVIIRDLNRYKRIGQYDFTKKDEGKIEPLIGKHPNDYCNSKLMWNKINELVEAVNRLKEKVNEMAQS